MKWQYVTLATAFVLVALSVLVVIGTYQAGGNIAAALVVVAMPAVGGLCLIVWAWITLCDEQADYGVLDNDLNQGGEI